MKLSFTTLDVFTKTPFSGNALAIVRVPHSHRTILTEEQKQKIANEFNLSETVFLHEAGDGGEVADYDIFTARSRMSFAGHPTIGTAIHLASTLRESYPLTTTLRTIAGSLPLAYDSNTGIASVRLPHDVHEHAARLPHPASSSRPTPESPSDVPIVSIVKGMAFALVPLKSTSALGSISAGLLAAAEVYDAKHLDAGSGWDVGFTGTFYYVDMGIDDYDGDGHPRRLLRTRMLGSREDPGTGSASSALCCYLALLERTEKGKAYGHTPSFALQDF
ncbi:hypothetical protein B0J12DRAFT_733444 [Macrophomina phaseolina]|uniref:Phenazine biosynthesis PhzC/PhzF protein n=1 Tax=Macrophomina phaseolina TaxID=35725 RepID=A0ABQ8FRX2_9PEZI|nr:hypothetical protein B0J12DRAFT_733444 [Macrophomina phaseolina]